MSYSERVVGLTPSSNMSSRFGSAGLVAYRGQVAASRVVAVERFCPSVSMWACWTLEPQAPIVNHSVPATYAIDSGCVNEPMERVPVVSVAVSTVTISSASAAATNRVEPTIAIPDAPAIVRVVTNAPE